MANYKAQASGNWNTAATWAGGAVPPNGAGHSIYSNTFTVTIDTNVDVALITNAAITATFVGGGTSALVGGGFAMTTANTLTGNIVAGTTAGATNCLTITGAGNTTITATQIYGSNPFTAGSGQQNSAAIINNSTGTLTISSGCSILSGSNTLSGAIYNNSTGTINVSGVTMVGGAGSSGSHGGIVNVTTGIINVSGGSTLTGFAAANNSSAIMNNGAGQVTITSCTLTGAGAGTSTVGGIQMGGAGTVTISNSTINASSTNNAVSCTAGTLVIVGCTMTATNAASAVNSSATNRFSGTFVSATNGQQAVNSSRWILNTAPTASYIQHALDGVNAGSYVRFYTADNTSGITGVATTNVRLGVSYGGGLVGACAVPAAGSVSLGVPVGSGTGTALLTGTDVATAVWGAVARTITGGTVTTLTNSPNVPSPASIASQVRTELTAELAKVSALNTDRLAQCATTSIVGSLIAQSNS